MKNVKKKWTRNCPNCGKELIYKYAQSFSFAKKTNQLCSSCSRKGNVPWNKGIPRRQETKDKISKTRIERKISPWNVGLTKNTDKRIQKTSESRKGIRFSDQHKKKISKNHANVSGKNNPHYGRTTYDIWLEKYGKKESDKLQKISNEKNAKSNRLRRIKEIEEKCGQCIPNYNSKSIPIIDAKAKELGITDLKHAENGGEVNIKEIGYWVDGYSKEKNIVIEYYEKWHENQIERDERRKQEIIEYLGCEFIEIKE